MTASLQGQHSGRTLPRTEELGKQVRLSQRSSCLGQDSRPESSNISTHRLGGKGQETEKAQGGKKPAVEYQDSMPAPFSFSLTN